MEWVRMNFLDRIVSGVEVNVILRRSYCSSTFYQFFFSCLNTFNTTITADFMYIFMQTSATIKKKQATDEKYSRQYRDA